ncbi:hypothetical protein NN4_45240 [Nocardia ninae NBRC 108245]|uniref:Uncharacterized protein n=1 Tax=Nocardia ninae NBRC 108245 TaxID=1210091 RepID=A0A511MH84_9NOCA|nr:hypothetical protein NN4_45240 [Nocardia ninae NBRC 108245]
MAIDSAALGAAVAGPEDASSDRPHADNPAAAAVAANPSTLRRDSPPAPIGFPLLPIRSDMASDRAGV